MATSGSVSPFSADALNRYRLIHTDREVRPLIRRLNRLPHKDGDDEERDEQSLAVERENVILDAEKWRFGIERSIASLRNMERQREMYLHKTEETVSRTEALKQMLVEEKALLAKRLAERDNRVKCDEVAKKILARGKTRKELAEQISALESSIAEHRTAYESVLAVGQARSDTFAKIVALVEECRALKLPAGASPEPMELEGDKKEAPVTKLSATSLPFQPTNPSSSASTPAPPARGPVSAPASRATTPAPMAMAAHGLPSRPTRSISQTSTIHARNYPRAPASLPPRPSNLRNVRGAGLEDGEVGEEDGEVKEGMKRKAAEMEAGAAAGGASGASGVGGAGGRSTRRK